MKKTSYMNRLNYRYFKENKKHYIVIMISIFLAVFLLMSLFVVKDSYQFYSLRNIQYQFGEWEINYGSYLNENADEQTKSILNSIDKKLYIKDYDLTPTTSSSDELTIFRSISDFNDLLPIHLIDGKYPTSENEILIDEMYAKEYSFHNKDTISFYDENNTIYEYKVSGIFKYTKNYTNSTFYTKMNDVSDYHQIYATISNNIDIATTINNSENINIHNEIWREKHPSKSLNYIVVSAIIFIFIASFLLLYNTYTIYLKKKQAFLTQLYTLGMTSKQKNLLLIKELFSFGLIFFLISIIISYFLWQIIIIITSNIITSLLKLAIPFACYLKLQSWLTIIILVFILFILLAITVFFKTKRRKAKQMKFRKIKLSNLNIEFRLGLLDIVRKCSGISIILSILVSITLFTSTHYLLNTWFAIENENYVYENNVDINFSFYDLTDEKFKKFNKEYSNFINHNEITKNNLIINWQTNVTLENVHYPIQINCINDEQYKDYFKKYDLKEEVPILVNHFIESNDSPISSIPVSTYHESINISVLSTYGELLHEFHTPYILNEDITLNSIDQDSLILLISYSQFETWLEQYPGGYISGTILLDTQDPDNMEFLVSNQFTMTGNDYMYVQNLEDNYNNYFESMLAIKLLLYSFIFIIILVCIISISNVIFQYQSDRKEDKKLFNTLGMSKKQWHLQTLSQSLFFTLISIFFSIPLIFGIIYFIYHSFFIGRINFIFPFVTTITSLVITILILFLLISHYSKKN